MELRPSCPQSANPPLAPSLAASSTHVNQQVVRLRARLSTRLARAKQWLEETGRSHLTFITGQHLPSHDLIEIDHFTRKLFQLSGLEDPEPFAVSNHKLLARVCSAWRTVEEDFKRADCLPFRGSYDLLHVSDDQLDPSALSFKVFMQVTGIADLEAPPATVIRLARSS